MQTDSQPDRHANSKKRPELHGDEARAPGTARATFGHQHRCSVAGQLQAWR